MWRSSNNNPKQESKQVKSNHQMKPDVKKEKLKPRENMRPSMESGKRESNFKNTSWNLLNELKRIVFRPVESYPDEEDFGKVTP